MTSPTIPKASASTRSPIEVARELGPVFDRRADEHPDEDVFVAENFADLRRAGLLEAGVPADLGGGGADVDELAAMLRELAYHCGSTALALSMHTHQVAIPAWRWAHQGVTAVEPLLSRVADERLVLMSSGGSDWIGGSGRAEKVDGGYRITARKVFSSGSPVGDLLMTSAVAEEDGEHPVVLHFAVPMASPNVTVLDTWRTLGMRGTGSNDVMIDGLVIPDGAVAARRAAGSWHPLFHVIATIAFPLIYAVYLGIAERARDMAIAHVKGNDVREQDLQLAGRMDTELTAARLAHGSMLDAVRRNEPSAATVNQVMVGRHLVARNVIDAVTTAMELAGGQGYFRSMGLERRFRDIQAARYHPLRPFQQAKFAGALAFGLPVDDIY